MDRTWINNIVINATNSIVQYDPFDGMPLINKFTWDADEISTKFLSTQEQELHPAMHRLFRQEYEVIIDIGCAAEFYAVDLASAFDRIGLSAFDLNLQALAAAQEAAEINNIARPIHFDRECSAEHLAILVGEFSRSLAILDCEGYELDLLCRGDVAKALRKIDFTIECHDFINGRITREILVHYLPSHNIDAVWAGERNPNDFAILANLTDP